MLHTADVFFSPHRPFPLFSPPVMLFQKHIAQQAVASAQTYTRASWQASFDSLFLFFPGWSLNLPAVIIFFFFTCLCHFCQKGLGQKGCKQERQSYLRHQCDTPFSCLWLYYPVGFTPLPLMPHLFSMYAVHRQSLPNLHLGKKQSTGWMSWI